MKRSVYTVAGLNSPKLMTESLATQGTLRGRSLSPMPATIHTAYTLLEVLVATAVLTMGLAAIMGITRSARQTSLTASDLAAVQLHCETTLNELLSQEKPIEPAPTTTIEETPLWKMTVGVYPSAKPGIFTVHVLAQKYTPQGDLPDGPSFQLLRWVPAHRVKIPAAEDSLENIDEFEDIFRQDG